MSNEKMSRRDAVKLARLGLFLSAGLGVSRIVNAETGEAHQEKRIGRDVHKLKDSGVIRGKRLLPNTYVAKVMKWNGEEFESVAIVPLNGDVGAALNDPNALLSIKVTSKQETVRTGRKQEPDRAEQKWKILSETEIAVSEAKKVD